jgi:hypothetical protein
MRRPKLTRVSIAKEIIRVWSLLALMFIAKDK